MQLQQNIQDEDTMSFLTSPNFIGAVAAVTLTILLADNWPRAKYVSPPDKWRDHIERLATAEKNERAALDALASARLRALQAPGRSDEDLRHRIDEARVQVQLTRDLDQEVYEMVDKVISSAACIKDPAKEAQKEALQAARRAARDDLASSLRWEWWGLTAGELLDQVSLKSASVKRQSAFTAHLAQGAPRFGTCKSK